jgi:heme-degrading monooxygenase HmoA
MHVVVTTVRVKPGRAEACAELFRATNPDLVRDEPDWLSARMVVDRERDEVMVTAVWRDAESYRRFSRSERFREVMGGFAEHFAGPPEVRITDLLVEMDRTS